MSSRGWRVRRDLGREELGKGETWVQEGIARDIDSEGSTPNSFCVYGRKGGTHQQK